MNLLTEKFHLGIKRIEEITVFPWILPNDIEVKRPSIASFPYLCYVQERVKGFFSVLTLSIWLVIILSLGSYLKSFV